MIYIYNDYGGTHTTSMAAAYHLHLLEPKNETLSKEEVLAIPYFNKLTKEDAGKLIYHGKDTEGHFVYTIGRKSSQLVVHALTELSNIFFHKFGLEERIIFSNTSPTVPFAMTIGGGLSRGLGIDSLGVPLLVKGAQKCQQKVYELVIHTKQIANTSTDHIVVLDNQTFKM